MLLEIEELTVTFDGFKAVDNLSLRIGHGETLGVLGESGSGKSMSMLALMGLVPWPGEVVAERIAFDGRDFLAPGGRRGAVGKSVTMIFQEPMTSLHPLFTVGFQIIEALRTHGGGGDYRECRERAVDLLHRVGIPDPEQRLDALPHEFSGGMNQRVMIAMAIACNPKLLIADEPTTSLDVTIQAQILDLLLELQETEGMSLILISHDMGVIANTVGRVVVMYAGQVVEERGVDELFARPRHPYPAALLRALPEYSRPGARRLPTIPGDVPGPLDRIAGCSFRPRCEHAETDCRAAIGPALVADRQGGMVRCLHPLTEEDDAGCGHRG